MDYPLSALNLDKGVQDIELREMMGVPYYWNNGTLLFNAQTGKLKNALASQSHFLQNSNVPWIVMQILKIKSKTHIG